MTETNTGSCLCGAVTYRIEGSFSAFYLCHCSRCRKVTGSAHASNLFAFDADFTWLSGEDMVRTYALPETRFGKAFCGTCGSALPRVAPDGSRVSIPAGSLDTEPDIRPFNHICLSSRAGWDHDLEDVPGLDGMPNR
ncbi:MAG: aldehyde-activating protein [Rhodobacteraceae bacterium]|nr:aldehyde-activating protein [Paracoccaceae bacterium]MAY44946.1 aldehyde-activating protein [Paracoccaceae bacterium]QEW24027.1 hypothetical protein LA6_006265 [Paracoccaceae bacterium]